MKEIGSGEKGENEEKNKAQDGDQKFESKETVLPSG
jgi:hypothetical protein